VLFQSEITDSERELTSRFVSNGFDDSFHCFYNFKKVCDSPLNRKEYGQEPAVKSIPLHSPLHEVDLAAAEGDGINHVRISETGRGPWGGVPERDWKDWRWQIRNRIRTAKQLDEWLPASPDEAKARRAVIRSFPFAIPPYYFSLIQHQDARDPIRLQCIPDEREKTFSLGGVDDPLAESRDMPLPGLIHRYADRCLILATHACLMYCRHCNRKRFWKSGKSTKARLQAAISYVAATPGIREVIISGGDPLTLPEGALDALLGSLRAIPHVEVLRIGSRVPVVLPMRITPSVVRMLRRHRPLWFNTQFNSPRELTPEAAQACGRLVEAGIPVSNQSVLLKGVNDSYETMRELLYGLQRISVRPYYLFQCDPVRGADHFRVDLWEGMELMERIARQTSGLCLPRYVLDVPGGKGKMPLQTFSLLTDSLRSSMIPEN